MLELLAASTATAFACGLGAIPVFVLEDPSRRLRAAMFGTAAGVMGVATVTGLLIPGIREAQAPWQVLAGAIIGIAFMLGVRQRLGESRRIATKASRASALVFIVLLVHSLPEGLAMGTAYAADPGQLGLFVVIAIAIQNVPEGTSVALPLAAAGASPSRQFWAATLSSMPQPVGALIAYELVREVTALLPLSFGFAAGAMAAVVAVQLLPDSLELDRGGALIGLASGVACMSALSIALGVAT